MSNSERHVHTTIHWIHPDDGPGVIRETQITRNITTAYAEALAEIKSSGGMIPYIRRTETVLTTIDGPDAEQWLIDRSTPVW